MKLDLNSSFNTLGYSVYEFYQRPGVGFYIPLYQREYSWDKDNILQLLEDIAQGVLAMIEHPDSEIRFLGTIITVNETDRKEIQPQDPRSLPTAIEKVIDGQQRLTTLALLCALLYKQILELEEKLLKLSTSNKDEIEETATFWKRKLIDMFSVDLQSGKPKRKPKIIRGKDDYWTRQDKNTDAYKSIPSLFLADFILSLEDKSVIPEPQDKKSSFGVNYREINKWLDNICNGHTDQEELYPKGWDILADVSLQEDLWNFERKDLVSAVNQKDIKNKKSESYLLCSLVQVFSVCHYLLDRCCFTVIQPKNEDWAFDMFQSLNASGTPLTAIETFRSIVVSETEREEKPKRFENTEINQDYERIQTLFRDTNSAAAKSKRTNDFLTSIAIVINAEKLESHFSAQRKYLDKLYKTQKLYTDKCSLISFMGNYADFYKNVWVDYKGENNLPIDTIKSNTEADLASLLILFLKQSNHRMSVTLLAYFYHDILEGNPNSIPNFIASVKAISAFYIFWRSAYANAGLDVVYRSFFKGGDKIDGSTYPKRDWISNKGGSLDIKELKAYFLNTLALKDIGDKTEWVKKSSTYLKYDNAYYVCLINLLISAHDTIPDPNNAGLPKIGASNSNPYLELKKWQSIDLKEIEHIAPQKGITTGWDKALYDPATELFNSIGNLTLLPSRVNQSVGNKGWDEKLLYYKHLSEKDTDKITELSRKAQKTGINLDTNTIKILRDASYSTHILPVLAVEGQDWNSKIVEDRNVRILEIVWDRIITWLQ
ncbi:MAG: DUF262 domain-containing protein [Cytophagales bacterium]|nr:MAG: DUF262 domain-containing protein [Cytophagales bacterium]